MDASRIPCLEELIRLLHRERKPSSEAREVVLGAFAQCYLENETCPIRGSDCFIRKTLQEGRNDEIEKIVSLMTSTLTTAE